MGSTQNKFQCRHTQEEFLFLREQRNNSPHQVVKIQELNEDVPFKYLFHWPRFLQDPKAKPTWHGPWHLVLPQARISGCHNYQQYWIWGFLQYILSPTLLFLLPQRLPYNFMVTGNNSHLIS